MSGAFESFNHSDKKAPNGQDQKDLLKTVKKTYLRKFVDGKTKSAARPNRVDIRAAVRNRFAEERKEERKKVSGIQLRDRIRAARNKHG